MKYLESPLFTQDESSLLLRLRTRCVNSIRNDFGGMYSDKNCPVNTNCNTLDTLQHLLVCQTVQESINTPIIATHKSIYEDLFSEDIFRQKEVTTLYQLLLETRERILSSPAAEAGPCNVETHEQSAIIITPCEIYFTYLVCVLFVDNT